MSLRTILGGKIESYNIIFTSNSISMATINGGSFKDIFESAGKAAISGDTLKSIAVSGLSAGITRGLTEKLNISNPNNFTDKLKKNAISNATSTVMQSTINGDSFTESLKHQAINTIVMTGADYGANKIGEQYHTNGFSNNNVINKATQLTLHAGLGAITNRLTGNDALSGAVSGVVGELTGEYLKNKGYNKQDGSELAGLASGIGSLFVGKIRDLDVSDIRDNVYSGYRVGKNAGENNAFGTTTIPACALGGPAGCAAGAIIDTGIVIAEALLIMYSANELYDMAQKYLANENQDVKNSSESSKNTQSGSGVGVGSNAGAGATTGSPMMEPGDDGGKDEDEKDKNYKKEKNSKEKSVNQMQQDIEAKNAPKDVDRADKGNLDRFEKDHIHLKDGRALNKDGTWKHNKSGNTSLPRAVEKWLIENGWKLPK